MEGVNNLATQIYPEAVAITITIIIIAIQMETKVEMAAAKTLMAGTIAASWQVTRSRL